MKINSSIKKYITVALAIFFLALNITQIDNGKVNLRHVKTSIFDEIYDTDSGDLTLIQTKNHLLSNDALPVPVNHREIFLLKNYFYKFYEHNFDTICKYPPWSKGTFS